MSESHPNVPDPSSTTVLVGLWRDERGTQYVDQLIEGRAKDIEYVYFSWRAALLGKYDVFHVHWPEMLIRGTNRLQSFLRRRALDCVILRSRIRRIPIVRTAHNVIPHEPGDGAEARSLARCDSATTAAIRLNEQTVVDYGRLVMTIPHGHYRPRFDVLPRSGQLRGRLLFIGIVRPYKGVLDLVAAFRATRDPSLSLRIVGSPGGGQSELLATAIAGDPRISTELSYVSDRAFVSEMSAAELIVFPYKLMRNSGVLLAALSVDRPVLVPRTHLNEAIADEVGRDWFLFYDELNDETLISAIETIRGRELRGRPNLSARDWSLIGQQHRAVYLGALALTRPQSERRQP